MAPGDKHLNKEEIEFKKGIIRRIEKFGYYPEMFFSTYKTPGLTTRLPWTATNVYNVMRRCDGAVIFGFPRWKLQDGANNINFATEYCHYEGAVAYTLDLSTLILAEGGIEPRVVFSRSFGKIITWIEPTRIGLWKDDEEINNGLKKWKYNLDKHFDIFLGYSSNSSGVADNIKTYLRGKDVEATVLDWHEDFAPGATIISEIEDAARRCSAGIFLFTKDDKLPTEQQPERAAPRDNVVFEAGYFAHAKSHDRVLIIREEGAKMPADLGGIIYASLNDRTNIVSVKAEIMKFLQKNSMWSKRP